MNTQRTLNFRHDSALGDVLLHWWRQLADDTGGRAALRRAPEITAVVMQPAFQRLYRRLLSAGWPKGHERSDHLAAAAGLLALLKEADESTLPIAMSQREGDKPRLSELRFKRLLESPDADALFTGLRRALPIIGYRCDPLGLATDVVNWGDAVRKRWAYSYDWPEKHKN